MRSQKAAGVSATSAANAYPSLGSHPNLVCLFGSRIGVVKVMLAVFAERSLSGRPLEGRLTRASGRREGSRANERMLGTALQRLAQPDARDADREADLLVGTAGRCVAGVSTRGHRGHAHARLTHPVQYDVVHLAADAGA